MTNQQPELEKAIAEGNSERVSQITQAILTNKGKSYQEALSAFEYVAANFPQGIEAYRDDQHDCPISTEQTKWNEDYFFAQKVALSYNFSRERFLHLVEVAKYLESRGLPNFQKRPAQPATPPVGRNTSSTAHTPNREGQSQKPNGIDPKLVVGGVLAVAGILFLLSR